MAESELIVDAPKFDYSILDKDEAGKLRSLSNDIQKLRSAIALNIMDIGKSLCSAQEVLSKRGIGTFQKFVESEGFSKSAGYNYMAAFRVFGDCPTVGRIEDGAMYALASNGTPEKALKEAMKLADKGTKITQKLARKIINKHRGSEPSKPKPSTPPKPAKPPAVQLTKDEQLKVERKKARAYADYLQRSIDDMNRIVRSPLHPKLIELCGQIIGGLDQW